MKNLSPINDNKDIVSKEYIDNLVGNIETILATLTTGGGVS